jgi:type VI secretion system secreted protein Hcp
MAAVDYFLKIDGIEGESADSKHKGEIEVLSFSWGVSNQTSGAGGGAGAGKPSVTDFSFTKFLDAATPQLMLASCTGEHIPRATFTARKAGDNQIEFLKITFTDILISSVQNGGAAGSDPAEGVSLSFGSAVLIALSQDPKGGVGKETTAVLCGGSKGR